MQIRLELIGLIVIIPLNRFADLEKSTESDSFADVECPHAMHDSKLSNLRRENNKHLKCETLT